MPNFMSLASVVSKFLHPIFSILHRLSWSPLQQCRVEPYRATLCNALHCYVGPTVGSTETSVGRTKPTADSVVDRMWCKGAKNYIKLFVANKMTRNNYIRTEQGSCSHD